MLFSGAYEFTIDAKFRLSIPYGVRAKLNPDIDGRAFFVLPGRRLGTLAIYPDRYFEKLRPIPTAPDRLPDAAFEWWQFEWSQTVLLDPDKEGRILIPEWLLERAGIGKDVALIGVQDHLELWPREAYREFITRKWPDYPAERAAAWRVMAEQEQSRDAIRAAAESG
ncbi:MAG: Transcriptional regulator MraZ [Phycisphaerae bacterium]|nr:Transcriptional regulator MraZ [Phycisphaerae bacterium]